MRDILNTLDAIAEASNLAPSELIKHEWRFKKVIEKIKNGEPFEDKTGAVIYIDPREARRLVTLYKSGQLEGPLAVKTVDEQGQPLNPVPLSALKKTPELQKPGGQATSATGQKKVTKEDALVKPTQIGITDRDIPAQSLYKTIVNNPVLNSTEYGKVVIQLANDIASGRAAQLPPEYTTKENEQIRKAIVDYAGEYLGVLALVLDQSNFPKKDEFISWLGGNLNDLILRFPSKANTNLADSYASITNPKTNHTLNISSKGTGGGAAPAISGLKIPDTMRRSKQYQNALQFIDICQKSDKSGGPTTITSAFDAIDLIYKINPKALPNNIQKILPLSSNPKLLPFVVEQIRSKGADQRPLPKKYDIITDQVSSKTATPSGKLVYQIKNIVQNAVNNNDAIPGFRDLILQILEMNFIQQYADYNNGTISFATQWPAKLEGDISLEHKSSAASPTDGGFSFKLGRPENFAADQNLGEPGPEDNPKPKGTANVVRQRRAQVSVDKTDKSRSKGTANALGRERRTNAK